jgi:hypothetical protein
MTKDEFNALVAKGKHTEAVVKSWLPKFFNLKKLNRIIEDISGVYRDADNDQVPDLKIIDPDTGDYYFIECKSRNMYPVNGKLTFGFSERFHTSYLNQNKKHGCPVMVAFHDAKRDPDHVYLLDLLKTPHDDTQYYDNKYGKGLAYKWWPKSLKKFPI